MVRWYAGRQCVGKPEVVTNQIAELVRLHDLRTVLPLVRFEKRPRGQFWVFYAIESDVPGTLPPQLAQLQAHSLVQGFMPRADGRGPEPFKLDDIRKMVTGEVSVQDYARRLRIHGAEPPSLSDPFPGGDELTDEETDRIVERTQRFDQLMAWVSAVGAGSRATFAGACQALGLAVDATEAGRLLRRLRLLGHVESSADGERWSVAPATLAEVASGPGWRGYVLCGERDDQSLDALRRIATVQETPPAASVGPARISVQSDDPERLAVYLAAAGLKRPPRLLRSCMRLAEVLPSIDGWQALLSVVPGISAPMFDVRRYAGGAFEPVVSADRTGFYELWPRAEQPGQFGRQTRPIGTYFYDADRDRWLRGDWYGLRYLDRLRNGFTCEARYDFLSARLAIAAEARPPELYERALVLCSGWLPAQRDGWLFYDDVQPDMLNTLAAKLNLTLVHGGTRVNATAETDTDA